jgi:hypothetical protein
MADGSEKIAAEICKGDVVRGISGNGKVVCVLKTALTKSCELVVLRNHLKITPWHPVFIDGKWTFPASVTTREMYTGNALYSFLLDQGHTMLIGGLGVICLGHGFGGEILAHPFLGTEKIVKAMEMMKGFEKGLVVVHSTIRDEKGLISGFL